MKRWEYWIAYCDPHSRNHGPTRVRFDEMGMDGWELVAVSADGWAYFKKEVDSQK